MTFNTIVSVRDLTIHFATIDGIEAAEEEYRSGMIEKFRSTEEKMGLKAEKAEKAEEASAEEAEAPAAEETSADVAEKPGEAGDGA